MDPFDAMRPGEILERTFTTIPDDLLAMVRAPFDHPVGTAVVGGSLLALVAVDRSTTKVIQHWERSTYPQPWFEYRKAGGTDSYVVALLPAVYAGSLALGSGRGQVAGLLSIKATAYSILVSQLFLKSAAGRNRPNPDLGSGRPAPPTFTNNPWDWGHVHRPIYSSGGGGTSFPSYHATFYASVAEVFRQVYELPWFLPYGAALVGFTSSGRHHHWFSDLVAGTLTGMGIGRVVVREFRGRGAAFRRGGLSASLHPFVDPQGASGLALRLAW